MTDSLYDKLKATATSHIRAFENTSGPSGSPFDPENVYKHRNPNCVMRFHPGSSMPPPFNGPITAKEHYPALQMIGAVTKLCPIDIHEMTVDVRTRVVAARITINFVLKAIKEDPKIMEWPIAYVWIVEMDESGEKIVRMEECLDTTRAGVMLERGMKYASENSSHV